AIREVFGNCERLAVNNTKSFIGHAMGAAGAIELLGNIPAFQDGIAHATINIDQLDPACHCGAPQIVANRPRQMGEVNYILNNSFGMLGINSVLIVKRFTE
ncbi:MAG: beta-ketoacyl-[acyl-carrier-protein] synthase family protein, partial [Planctomycetes bacterium]|nr:beta-ketoacyl-[acyl-carrier-protein] synthase family protein [Planctomycetota bacterium]